MKFSLPLSVQISKKKAFILNLNNYRNAHFQVLNKAKKMYVDEVRAALCGARVQPFRKGCQLIYTLYQPTNRRIDISNPLSIVDKFTCDALVEIGVLVDDSSGYLPRVTYIWGGVDKENPRVDVEISSQLL